MSVWNSCHVFPIFILMWLLLPSPGVGNQQGRAATVATIFSRRIGKFETYLIFAESSQTGRNVSRVQNNWPTDQCVSACCFRGNVLDPVWATTVQRSLWCDEAQCFCSLFGFWHAFVCSGWTLFSTTDIKQEYNNHRFSYLSQRHLSFM